MKKFTSTQAAREVKTMSIEKIKVIGVGFESGYQTAEKEQPTWDDVRKAIKLAYHKGYNIGQEDAELHPLALTIANHIHEDTEEIIKHLKQDRD